MLKVSQSTVHVLSFLVVVFCCFVDFPDSTPKVTESAVDKPSDDGRY